MPNSCQIKIGQLIRKINPSSVRYPTFPVREIDYPMNILHKNRARPRRTSAWFTGIEYAWCTNLAISVVAWFYQCVSLQCSCDALQLVTLSRGTSRSRIISQNCIESG